MIPKIIHYCWFGNGSKSDLVRQCIDSWKRIMPEYNIIEWNESNTDIASNHYIREAYEAKKWAFVSDYVRLSALLENGGIYLDTDVEVFKTFDAFLDNHAFMGFESNDSLVTAVIGAEKNNASIRDILDAYNKRHFINQDGSLDMTTNVTFISEYFLQRGMIPNGKQQDVLEFKIYPQIYFSPNNVSRIWGRISSKTYSVHHFEGSWNGKSSKDSLHFRCRRYLVGKARDIIGTDKLSALKKK